MDMPLGFWLMTGITLLFLGVCLFAWWLIGRAENAVSNSEEAVNHSMTAAQNSNRAVDRADQLLDHLTEWWDELADEQERRDPEPSTEPIPRTAPGKRTDTEEAATVITPQAIEPDPAVEQWAREQMAQIVARIEGEPEKPAPKKRVARKATA